MLLRKSRPAHGSSILARYAMPVCGDTQAEQSGSSRGACSCRPAARAAPEHAQGARVARRAADLLRQPLVGERRRGRVDFHQRRGDTASRTTAGGQGPFMP